MTFQFTRTKTHTIMINKLFIIIFFSSFYLTAKAQQVRFATFNVRGDFAKDAPANSWKDRADKVVALIDFHEFGVFGVQEADDNQLADMKNGLPTYEMVKDASHKGLSALAIFFKKENFELLKSGSFWLAPDQKSTEKAWDAKYPRGCTWVNLRDKKTGKVFYYFNTHLDHVGVLARANSTILIAEKMKEFGGADVAAAVGGDFNFDQFDDNYPKIQASSGLVDAYIIAQKKYTPNGTFNGFNITRNGIERIDHIFLTKNANVLRYGILTDNFGGKFPSDHFPVVIDVDFKN